MSFKYADLTGQDVVIGKVNEWAAQKALVAMLPLSYGEARVMGRSFDRRPEGIPTTVRAYAA
jgi:hypothetical protein